MRGNDVHGPWSALTADACVCLLQSSQGRAYTRPLGLGTRGGARLQLPKPELKEHYLEVPSYSQLNASVPATDDIMAAADPYARPIIITDSLQGGLFRVDLGLKCKSSLHAYNEVSADPRIRCVICVLACSPFQSGLAMQRTQLTSRP